MAPQTCSFPRRRKRGVSWGRSLGPWLSSAGCCWTDRVGPPVMRFPGGKEAACQCRRCRFNPWVRRIPWRREWQATPGFLPGKFFQRSLVGYSPWGRKESDMTEQLNNSKNRVSCKWKACLAHLPSIRGHPSLLWAGSVVRDQGQSARRPLTGPGFWVCAFCSCLLLDPCEDEALGLGSVLPLIGALFFPWRSPEWPCAD